MGDATSGVGVTWRGKIEPSFDLSVARLASLVPGREIVGETLKSPSLSPPCRLLARELRDIVPRRKCCET